MIGRRFFFIAFGFFEVFILVRFLVNEFCLRFLLGKFWDLKVWDGFSFDFFVSY